MTEATVSWATLISKGMVKKYCIKKFPILRTTTLQRTKYCDQPCLLLGIGDQKLWLWISLMKISIWYEGSYFWNSPCYWTAGSGKHHFFSRNSLDVRGSGGLAFHYRTYLDSSDDPSRLPKFRVILNISNCTFYHHYPNISSTEFQSESSVILGANVPYFGINGITVNSNNCTGILGIASTLVFFNSTKNTALTGGGIRLCTGTTNTSTF